MKARIVTKMTTDELVDRFIAISIEQGKALASSKRRASTGCSPSCLPSFANCVPARGTSGTGFWSYTIIPTFR
jgi:hypothetical protein